MSIKGGYFRKHLHVDLTAGQPEVLLKDYQGVQVESAVNFDMSPDGRSILVAKPKDGAGPPRRINVVLNWFEVIKKVESSGN